MIISKCHVSDKFRQISSGWFIRGKMITTVIATFLVLAVPLRAQNNTLYLMHSIPQANQLNPALMHPCSLYISLPVISSIRQSFRNTGFGYHDVFFKGTGAHANDYYMDVQSLDRYLRKNNWALANTDVDILGFGFPVREWYLTFGIASHLSAQGSYPHDIVMLEDLNLSLSTGVLEPVVIKKIRANSTAWNSIGISASREVMKGLRVGVRLKYLNGMANMITKNSLIDISSAPLPYPLQAMLDYGFNTSLPMTINLAPDGSVSSINLDPARHNIAGNYIFSGNRGLALDGGILYNLDEATQLSASFTDLGFIRWKNNINNFTINERYLFSQADIGMMQNDPGQGDLMRVLGDSLRTDVFPAAAKGYFTTLPFNIYGGITRELRPNVKAGAMTWIEINNGQFRPSMTLSMNFTPFRAFAASLSYTLMNNKWDQVGAGLAVGQRGAQFYIVADNIPVRWVKDPEISMVWPYNARMATLRFGLNIFIGCNEKEKKGKAGGGPHKPGKRSTRDSCPAYW